MKIESPFHIMAILGQQEPLSTRVNPPGQAALTYRAGNYGDFVARMLHNLRTQAVTDVDGRSQQPLLKFNLLAGEDWTQALIRSWAIVADILAFYQERIINESYLRTAVERRSVLELIRATGYELAPPLAATTHLAFNVRANPQDPGPVRLPAGIAVQGIPNPFDAHEAVKAIVQGVASPGGDLLANVPIIFETTAETLALPEWNNLTPSWFVDAAWPADRPDRSLRLAGMQTGLNVGDGLLILSRTASDANSSRPWELLILDAVTPDPAKGWTAVTWSQTYGHVPANGIPAPQVYALRRQADLYPYSAGAVFRDTGRGWAPASIGLPAKPVRAAAANWRGRIYVAIEGSLYSSRDLGDTWQPLTTGLAPKAINAIAASPTGAVAIGADEGYVVLSKDGGDGWTPLSGPGQVESPTGWRRFFEPVRHKMPKTVVRTLLHTADKARSVLAGTDDGVFAFDAELTSWQPMNGRFPNVDREKGVAAVTVQALAAVNRGRRILAGTMGGVFPVEPLFRPPGNKLLLAFLGFLLLLPTTVASLLEPPSDLPPSVATELIAPAGIESLVTNILIVATLLVLLYQLQPGRLKVVVALVAMALYATRSQWVISAQTEAIIVNLLAQLGAEADAQQAGTLILNPVTILLLILLVANAAFAALVQLPGLVRRIPLFTQSGAIQPPVFDLLAAGDVVYAATNRGVFQLAAVLRWDVRFARWLRRLLLGPEPEPWTPIPGWFDYPLDEDDASRTVYALTLDEDGRLMAGTASGEIYVRRGDDWLREAGVPLSAVRSILNARGVPIAAGQPEDARSEKRWALAQLDAGFVDLPLQPPATGAGSAAVGVDAESAALFTVTARQDLPSHDVAQGGQITRLTVNETSALAHFHRLQTRFYYHAEPLLLHDDLFVDQPVTGRRLLLGGDNLKLAPGQRLALVGIPTSGTDQPIGEYIIVEAVIEEEARTVLRLVHPLQRSYRRDSVTLYGNLAPAVHGETISNEPLGESDGTRPNQRFQLRRPLAYVPTASGNYRTTLSAAVGGIPWQKVPSLLDQAPDARVYMVRRDASGQTTLIFGDGEQGSRLPTSRERLTASYRSGGGPAGNVPIHSLTLLQSRTPLLSGVTNPLPAEGGAPAESMAQGRLRAPRLLRALGRIVAANDFAAFAASYPGVGKAVVRRDHGSSLTIAIAPRRPEPLPPDDALLANVAAAIDYVRAAPEPAVELVPYRLLWFGLDCSCHLDTSLHDARQDARDALVREIRQRVLSAFDYDDRELGQPVTDAEIVALLQNMPEIIAVTLHALQSAGFDEGDRLVEWNALFLPDPERLTIRLE